MFTGKQLAEYCERVYKAGWVYWYGTYGKRCTESLYKSKKSQYPSHYTAARADGYKRDIAEGRWCADCVGLIKSFFWKGGDIGAEPKYASNHCPDTSANGMISLCSQTGKISSIPDEPGLVVWHSGHIGVYVGGGYVVELMGFNYDCKRRKVSAGTWTKWGRLPSSMITYGAVVAEPEPEPEGDRYLQNGDEGADVKQLQLNLIALGYDCGKWGADGDFGDCTEQALKQFQRDRDLTADGIYGAETIKAMEAALELLNAQPDTPREVLIHGGNCYVRATPSTVGAIMGVAYDGDRLTYNGQTSDNGWQSVIYKGNAGWVSGKYGRLV